MATLRESNEFEVKRMHETYGPEAEAPSAAYAPGFNLRADVPEMPIAGRIAEFAKRVTDAGHRLAEARAQYRNAQEHK